MALSVTDTALVFLKQLQNSKYPPTSQNINKGGTVQLYSDEEEIRNTDMPLEKLRLNAAEIPEQSVCFMGELYDTQKLYI